MAPVCGVSDLSPDSKLLNPLYSHLHIKVTFPGKALTTIFQIMIMDYFMVRRGNIHVPSLYNGRPRGLYWFTSGVHIPGIISWFVGVSLGLPGLVGTYKPLAVNQAAKNMYS